MTLQTMLARLARSQSELDWDEWYVLALAAHEEPDQWRGAWERLDADDREALLTRLHNDAGPLADHVIRSILPGGSTQPDDPTLELAHEDAAAATARQLERLKRIGRRAELDTGEVRAALEAHIDIESLRQEAERLRAQAARDPELAERNALEKEITRLKALMSTLQAYDWKAREAEQRRLAGDTEALKANKTRLEESIREARQEHEHAKQELAEVQAEWQQKQARLESLRTQVTETQQRVAQVQAVAQGLDRLIHDLHSALDQASAQLTGTGQALTQLGAAPPLADRRGPALMGRLRVGRD